MLNEFCYLFPNLTWAQLNGLAHSKPITLGITMD